MNSWGSEFTDGVRRFRVLKFLDNVVFDFIKPKQQKLEWQSTSSIQNGLRYIDKFFDQSPWRCEKDFFFSLNTNSVYSIWPLLKLNFNPCILKMSEFCGFPFVILIFDCFKNDLVLKSREQKACNHNTMRGEGGVQIPFYISKP